MFLKGNSPLKFTTKEIAKAMGVNMSSAQIALIKIRTFYDEIRYTERAKLNGGIEYVYWYAGD